MDPADSDPVRNALKKQGSRLQQHEEQLGSINQGVRDLHHRQGEFQASINEQVSRLTEQLHRVLTHLETGPAATPSPAATAPVSAVCLPMPTPRLAAPERFSGDSGDCRPFLVQCDLHFNQLPAAFPTEQSKIAFVISHLTGRAAAWATAEWARDSAVCKSITLFTETLKKIFDHTTPSREAARALVHLKQNQRRVADYAIEFRTLAADSGWNELALLDAFLHGLSDSVKDQLAPLELPTDLDSTIAIAIRIDNRLQERIKEKKLNALHLPHQEGRHNFSQRGLVSTQPVNYDPSGPSTSPEEPMQLGRTKLSAAERQRRLREGRCFYCGELGHLLAACPAKGQAHQ